MKIIHGIFSILFFGLIAAYFFVFLVAYWLFWPYQTLQINGDTSNVPVASSTIKAGDPILYKLNFCKYGEYPVTVHRTMDDGQVIFLPNIPGELPTGCHSTIIQTMDVPDTINAGTYYLAVDVTYQVNPIRSITVQYKTEKFRVIK